MKFQADISMPYTHTHTDKPKPICLPLFQSWGHKKIYNTNIDLVNDNVFGLILSIRSQDIEQKPNSDINQRP